MFLSYLLLVFPTVAVFSLLSYLPFYFYGKIKGGKKPFIRHLSIYAYIGVIWSVLYITLFLMLFRFGLPDPFPAEYRFVNLIPFVWVVETYDMGFAAMIRQLLMNMVMLIPMGIFGPVVFKRLRCWWKNALHVAGFIFCVETVQYFIGRSADVDDLIMNTFGGIIGYGIFCMMNRTFAGKSWWQNALGA